MTDAGTNEPLAEITRATFAPLVGHTLVLAPPEGDSFEAELIEASDESRPDGRHGPADGRAPFSLILRPLDGSARPQATYAVTSERLPTLAIFCVPTVDDDGRPVLQAVFN